MLAYGTPADAFDEIFGIAESTALLTLEHFVDSIIKLYKEEYLRPPNDEEITRILEVNRQRGFPGCLGSIDCQHWFWKNCPMALQGMFKGKEKRPTIVLEAICDRDLYIWHAFFGVAGSNNDFNVLNTSPLIDLINNEIFPPARCYAVGDKVFTRPYFLGDGIYPPWGIFAKTITCPTNDEERKCQKAQEAVRKDIERLFGVLIQRFRILDIGCRLWKKEIIGKVM